MNADLRGIHNDALADATALVDRLAPEDLRRPSACAGWSVAQLLAHMVGQHHGFTAALRDGEAPASAYVPIPFTRRAWDESVAAMSEAFASRALDDTVLEVELHPTRALPVATLLGAQFLDTVIHTWDLAWGLGETFEPPAQQAEIVLGIAQGIPDTAYGTDGGTAFAPRLPVSGSAWQQALALVGRDPMSVGGRG
ncbi:TIGR03086 family protein [Occultella glacieicola]|uniref:TIGR03086 family protein n=1 Tax=Occultella glacieicola TaxID=2518684 RepID=A0ABY2EB33_9MICO|nr:TIGR03086 family metal-binding protein [Occultella glacieicola]TDE97439.1 TIGR03086 family protein [Occultella glacieicola]